MKLPSFGVEEWLNVWETKAIYDIAGSSIDSLTLEEILALGQKDTSTLLSSVLNIKMNYGWIEGSPAFKEEVCKLYETIQPSQVLQTNGATGANLLALYSLIEPGDHVISLYPTYQQLYDIPKSFGAEVDFWQLKEEDWMPSLEDLKELIRPNTKMICLNNANNPTGTVFTREYLLEIVRLARKVGAYILVDEVYKPFDESIDVPAIVDLYEKGISTNSLSKTFSVPGVRVGWIVASDEITEEFRKNRDYTMICDGVLDDLIATFVLKHKEIVLKRNQLIVHENLDIVRQWLNNEPRVSLIEPKYVSTSFIKLDIPIPVEQFCIDLLNEEGVLLVPGNRFGKEGFARLGYCAKKDILVNGLFHLSKHLKRFD